MMPCGPIPLQFAASCILHAKLCTWTSSKSTQFFIYIIKYKLIKINIITHLNIRNIIKLNKLINLKKNYGHSYHIYIFLNRNWKVKIKIS